MKKKTKGAKSNSLKDRMKKSYESKDKGGSSRPQALDWKKVEGIKFYKPKDGKNKINIIPYIVKTKNDPLVHSGDAKVGDQSYMLDVFLHKNIGPSQAEFVCPKSTYGKPCPACKQAAEFKEAGKKDEANALWPKRTCFYNVQDAKNPEAGLQVFQVSHYLFEKELIEEARESSDDGDIIDFVDIDDGKSISFRAADTEKAFNGKTVTYLEYKSFTFPERDEPLDESLIEQAVSFDEIIKVLSEKEIEELMFGDDDTEDDDEKPKSKAKATPKSKAKDDDEDEDEDDEEESDEDDDDSDSEEEESDEDDDEDEDEDDEDDDEEDDDDEEADDDDEPVKSKSAVKGKAKEAPAKEKAKAKEAPAKSKPDTKLKVSKNTCPSGFKFGIDTDKKDECEDCDNWTDCLKEKNKAKKK